MRHLSCLFLCALIQQVACTGCGTIFLTVNAVSNNLEYNWNFESCVTLPDALTITHRSHDAPERILHKIDTLGKLEGHSISNIAFGNPRYPGNWNENDTNPILGSHCYPFWIRSSHQSEIMDEECLRIEPSWMANFGKLRIGNMMIPGSHDSGAWTANYISLITRFLLTQDRNLWEQLVSGIRYLDIRVGIHHSETPKEWINHGKFKCSHLRDELLHVAKFLKASPKEVVILHMKGFEYPSEFSLEEHYLVKKLLEEILGEFALPRIYFNHENGPVLEDIWATGRNLIISYNNWDLVNDNDWLWNNIDHKWRNTANVNELREYMDGVKNEHNHAQSPFCALMAELTPDTWYVITHLHQGLHYMADEVNPELNKWLTKYNWSDSVNVVATDFFLGNNGISISIEANNKKLGRHG